MNVAAEPLTVTIEAPPGWGVATLVLRGLTRGEVRAMASMAPDECEALGLSLAAVQPTLTVEEAARLLEGCVFGDSERVWQTILALTGLSDADTAA